MAYKNDDKIVHAFKRISEDLKKGDLKNLLVFHGREEYLKEWACKEIIKKYINEATKELDLTFLDGSSVSFTDIRNSCETLTMLSDKRVVVINDFKLAEGQNLKTFSDDDEKYLCDYIENIPDTCFLIIVSESLDKRKKFGKTAVKVGGVYDFCELDEKQLISFINKKFKENGKKAEPAVLRQIVESSGYFAKESDYTLLNLENDIKKILAFSNLEEVHAGDVASIVSGNIDTNVFAMIDALSRNRKDEAYQLLNNQLLFGENIFKLLAMISSQFEIILFVKEMKSNGMNMVEMKERLNIHEFRIKKASVFAERYSLAHLKDILKKAYSVDKNVKSGLLEASLAMELFIAEI